jgi:hypothetical protein
LIQQLHALVAGGAIPPQADLKEVDRKYTIVDAYLNKFKQDILVRFSKFQQQQEKLLTLLKAGLASDETLEDAEDLVRSMEDGLLEQNLIADLEQGKGRIDFDPPDPVTEQIVTFRFVFRERQQDESFLAHRLRYEWNFGDGTRAAVGKERVHYFRKTTSDPGYKVRVIIKDRAGNTVQKQEQLQKQGEAIQPFYDVRSLPVRELYQERHQWYRPRDISLVEGVAFGAAFLIAVGFAFAVHFDEIQRFQSVKDYLTPFLWGFGLEQGKSGFLEAFKTLTERAAKVA